MPEQGGWVYQGRQYHMWFGHGTKPQDAPSEKNDLGSLDERIRILGLTAIAGLPQSKRYHAATSFDGPTLDRLVETMRAWVGKLSLGHADFAARFFGRPANSPVVEHLRRSAEIVAGATTRAQMRDATDELAAGMMAVGLDGWRRLLTDAHKRATAAAFVQSIKDNARPGHLMPSGPFEVFTPGSPENETFIRGTEHVLRELGRVFNNESQDDTGPPVSGATPGEKTRSPSTQWVKPGGMAEADRDFDDMHPKDVRPLAKGGRVGELPDGRTTIVRPYRRRATYIRDSGWAKAYQSEVWIMSVYFAIWQDIAANHRFELNSLLDAEGKLRLEIINDTNRKFTSVSETCLSYRRMDEGDALVGVDDLVASAGTAKVFYRVEKSEFLEWFHLQSDGIYKNRDIQHFSICTLNDIIDLITYDIPEIVSSI